MKFIVHLLAIGYSLW